MYKLVAAAIGFSLLTGLGPVTARADSMWDLQNARANARAGGPVSDYDKELLGRWGCLSGSRSAYCKSIRHGANSGRYRAKRNRRR